MDDCPCIIIYGDPLGGFLAAGPFDNQHLAIEWAAESIEDCPWWFMPLQTPE